MTGQRWWSRTRSAPQPTHRPEVGFSDEPTMCACGVTWYECQRRAQRMQELVTHDGDEPRFGWGGEIR